jgi:hypothetical protein
MNFPSLKCSNCGQAKNDPLGPCSKCGYDPDPMKSGLRDKYRCSQCGQVMYGVKGICPKCGALLRLEPELDPTPDQIAAYQKKLKKESANSDLIMLLVGVIGIAIGLYTILRWSSVDHLFVVCLPVGIGLVILALLLIRKEAKLNSIHKNEEE